MRTTLVIVIGGIIVIYFLAMEAIDMAGRIEYIRDHFPKLVKRVEHRAWHRILLIVTTAMIAGTLYAVLSNQPQIIVTRTSPPAVPVLKVTPPAPSNGLERQHIDTPPVGVTSQLTAVVNSDCDQDQPRSKYIQMFPQFTALVAFDCARKLKDLIGDCDLEKAQLRQKFDEREKNQPDQLQQIEGGYQNQVFMTEKNCLRRYSTKYRDNAIIVRDFIVNQQLRSRGMGDGSEYASVSTLDQLQNVIGNLEALGRYAAEGRP